MSEFTLPFALATTHEANQYINALETLQSEEYLQTKVTFNQVLTTLLPYTLSEKLQRALQTSGILDKNQSEQQTYFEKLKEKIKSLPQVKLTLAFVPTQDFLQECCKDLSTILKQPVLIDLTIDQAIIAGAQISYNGKYIDATTKHQLEIL